MRDTFRFEMHSNHFIEIRFVFQDFDLISLTPLILWLPGVRRNVHCMHIERTVWVILHERNVKNDAWKLVQVSSGPLSILEEMCSSHFLPIFSLCKNHLLFNIKLTSTNRRTRENKEKKREKVRTRKGLGVKKTERERERDGEMGIIRKNRFTCVDVWCVMCTHWNSATTIKAKDLAANAKKSRQINPCHVER